MSDNKKQKLSIKTKYEIITKLKSGVKRDLLLSEYKLKSYSHLTHILKSEAKITAKYNSIAGKTSGKVFAVKEAKFPLIEKALIEWMRQEVRNKKINLTGDIILQKAEQFAQQMGVDLSLRLVT